jgi:hypothetical protein
MPSTSKKQHNFMEAVANNPKFAKKAGVPQSVGKEFAKADKGMKFRQGGVKRMASGGKVKRYVEGGTLEMMTGEKQNGPEYSTDDIKEGLKKLGRFFGFSRPESEPPAPIETRRGSPKPFTKANVSDEDPLGSAKLTADAQQRMSEAVLKPVVGISKAPAPRVSEESQNVFGTEKAQGIGSAPRASAEPIVQRVAAPKVQPLASMVKAAPAAPSPEVASVRKSEAVERVVPKNRDQKIAENKKVIEEKILASKPTALTAQMRKAPTGEQLYAGQQSLSDFLMSPFKSLREGNEARRKEEEKRRKDVRDRAIARQEEGHMAKGGKVNPQKFAKGGFVKKSIDGCAQRGKTRGQMK